MKLSDLQLATPVTGVLMMAGTVVQGAICEVPEEDVPGHPGRFFVQFQWPSGGWIRAARYLGDEGITWVKGHLAEDSTEVLAMQAAWALEYR